MKAVWNLLQILGFFLFLWFVDQQLSLFVSYLIPNHWYPVVHGSLLFLLFASVFFSTFALLGASLIAGLLLDSYVFHSLGVLLVLLPLCVLFVTSFNRLFLRNIWTILLATVLLISLFEGLYFGAATLMGMVSLDWTDFVALSLAPSLAVNLLLSLLVTPLCRQIRTWLSVWQLRLVWNWENPVCVSFQMGRSK